MGSRNDDSLVLNLIFFKLFLSFSLLNMILVVFLYIYTHTHKHPIFRFRKFLGSFYRKQKLDFLKCFLCLCYSNHTMSPLICLSGDDIYRLPKVKSKFCS